MGEGSRLFRAYAAGDPAAVAFFAHDARSPTGRAAAAAAAAAWPRDRAALADALTAQNAAWGNMDGAAEQTLAALRHPEGVAVLTGQQLGLFGGPLLTLYKAVTAIQLARRLAEETGRPVAPVFWLASEDHDWEEVRRATVPGDASPVDVALPPSGSREPVGRRRVDEAVLAALDALEAALRPTEFSPGVLAALRTAYRPGTTHTEAFGRWLAHLFAGTGLLLVSPDDPALKRLAAPVLRAELEDPAATLGALLEAGRVLEAAGFHQQVTPLPGQLFLMEPEGRLALDPEPGGGFVLRGTGRRLARADVQALLEAEPERFSPNVVLRPIVQDALFPTAAYVGGPGEVAYHAQLGGVYDRFGVPRPAMALRASVTLVEARVRRALERLGLALEELTADPEHLHRRLALARSPLDVEGAFARAARALDAVVDALRPVAQGADPTLGRSAEAFRAALHKELAALETKVVRAEKRNHDALREALDRARGHLFPKGRLQERVLSPVYYLAKYGPDLAVRLVDGLAPETDRHQVVEL